MKTLKLVCISSLCALGLSTAALAQGGQDTDARTTAFLHEIQRTCAGTYDIDAAAFREALGFYQGQVNAKFGPAQGKAAVAASAASIKRDVAKYGVSTWCEAQQKAAASFGFGNLMTAKASSGGKGGRLPIANGTYSIGQPNCAAAAPAATMRFNGTTMRSAFGTCTPRIQSQSGNVYRIVNECADGSRRVSREATIQVIDSRQFVNTSGGYSVPYYLCSR